MHCDRVCHRACIDISEDAMFHAGDGHTSKTVISTGMTVPTLSCVAALYSLQKAMMLTPCNSTMTQIYHFALSNCDSNKSMML